MKPIKDFLKNIQGKKFNELLIIITLVAVVLVFISDYAFNGKSNSNNTKNSTNVTEVSNNDTSEALDEDSKYEKELEEKLTAVLESMDKVGKVKVMIHLGAGEEKVPVYNSNDSTSVTEEKDTNGGNRKINSSNNGETVVMKSEGGNSEPFITQTKKPIITGVVITAEGAADDLTKLIITKTVTDLFGIGPNKVNVYPMKK
ncbi:MAG: stage III sporulation protein AG [Clostridiaceae bacterium]